jgi:hypothetical protein
VSPDPGISIHRVIEAIHSDRSRLDVVLLLSGSQVLQWEFGSLTKLSSGERLKLPLPSPNMTSYVYAAKALLSVSSMARKKTSGVEAFAEEVDAD